MNVLKSLFPLVVLGMAIASPNDTKACDAFFPTGQAFAFSNGYQQQVLFSPGYGYGVQQRFFQPPVVRERFIAPAPSLRIVQEQRGLLGRVRSRQVVEFNR